MKAEDLVQYVPVQYLFYTVVVLIIIFLVILKITPIGIKWFHSLREKTNNWEQLNKNVKESSEEIKLINQKIGRDYARLNQIQEITEKQQNYIEESLEERELILKSLLGVIKGLQEIGANGPTKKAESEIQAYLLKKSHDVDVSNVEHIK